MPQILNVITTDVQALLVYSRKYLEQNNIWQEICQEAGDAYLHDLKTKQELENTISAINISTSHQNKALLIDKAALSIIFGLTHYLNWAGYNIENPTNFEEVSQKLKLIRVPAKKVATVFFMQHNQRIRSVKSLIQECFGIGVAIGSLIETADNKGIQSIDTELSFC